MSKISLEADLEQDEELVASKKKVYKKPIPPFLPIGRPGANAYKIQGIDMPNILKDLSKGSSWFLWMLVITRRPNTNVVLYKAKDTAEKNRIIKAYKELHDLSLIIRIKRGRYLINPKAILPYPLENYEEIWAHWMSLNP